LIGLAQVYYEWNDLEKSLLFLREALTLNERCQQPQLAISAHSLLALILMEQKKPLEAQACFQDIYSEATNDHLRYDADLAHARFALKCGKLTEAQHYLQVLTTQTTPFPTVLYHDQITLLTIRLLLAQGCYSEALTRLVAWQDPRIERERGKTHFERLLLFALVHARLGNLPIAQQTLIQLVHLTATEGYQRLFLDEGEPMLTLLRSILPDLDPPSVRAYVQHLLLSMTSADQTQTTYGLTSQEQRVLRLLASGKTQQEIASHLIVSRNTIKSQLQSIYRKLNVTSRLEASALARQLHLL
jgi:LuxR family maltose regulon positive regulatory protein